MESDGRVTLVPQYDSRSTPHRKHRPLALRGTRHRKPDNCRCDHQAFHNRIPAIQAERKFARVPASIARKPSRARSAFRLGASAPIPPI